MLGLGEAAVFFRVTLPLAWRGILAGVLLAFARALGEFGATLMVAGSIPGKTQTLSIAVYEAVQAGQDDLANLPGAADLGDLHRRAAARRPARAGAHSGPLMRVGRRDQRRPSAAARIASSSTSPSAATSTRLVLFGPSGAGKTMTLKAIAGLVRPDAGRIEMAGETLFDAARGIDTPARQRDCGYLFQEYALFPHLTVRQNIAFGLAAGWRNPRRDGGGAAVDRWLDALELRAARRALPRPALGRPAPARRARPRARRRAARAAARRALRRARRAAAQPPARRAAPSCRRASALPILLITHDPADVDAFADDVVHIDAGTAIAAPAQFLEEHPMKSSARNQLVGTVSAIIAGAVNDEVEITLGGGQRVVAVVTHEQHRAARPGRRRAGVRAGQGVVGASSSPTPGRRCSRRATSSPAPSSACSRAPSTPRSRSTPAACASSPSSPRRARARSASRRACRRSPCSRRRA